VCSDSSSVNPTQCGVPNAFVARAQGGVCLITGGAFPSCTGALLPANQAARTTFSDRSGEENVEAVDPRHGRPPDIAVTFLVTRDRNGTQGHVS
jgi:hypothetical protein